MKPVNVVQESIVRLSNDRVRIPPVFLTVPPGVDIPFEDGVRTTPTLLVLVIMMGVSRNPDSVTQVVPVISPFPLRLYQLAKTGLNFLPLGKTAVTPVRTGPLPITFFPLPEMMVQWPTSTPDTSVIALSVTGFPSNEFQIPCSRFLSESR